MEYVPAQGPTLNFKIIELLRKRNVTGAANKIQIVNRSLWVSYEAWNRYVLAAIGLFGMLLYVALVYAGIAEFISRLSNSKKNRRRTRSKATPRRFRTPKTSGD